MSRMCTKEKLILEEFTLNNLAKITLPKSAPNYLGNIFVPNGIWRLCRPFFCFRLWGPQRLKAPRDYSRLFKLIKVSHYSREGEIIQRDRAGGQTPSGPPHWHRVLKNPPPFLRTLPLFLRTFLLFLRASMHLPDSQRVSLNHG